MVKLKTTRTFDCCVEATLGVVGGKWKSVILFHLMKKPIIRFGEFRRLLPKVTQQMLTAQLRELESDEIIHRKVYPQVPPKVEYSLTELGKTLAPVIQSMAIWGDTYEKRIVNTSGQVSVDHDDDDCIGKLPPFESF